MREPADQALVGVREQIEALPDGPNTLLRLTLTGAVGSHELPLVDQLETWLQARCDNQKLLYDELRSELRTTEALEGALRDLAESDEVVAGAVADLRAMVQDFAESVVLIPRSARTGRSLLIAGASLR